MPRMSAILLALLFGTGDVLGENGGGAPPPGSAPAPGSPTGSTPGQNAGSPTGSTPGQDLASPTGSVPGIDNNSSGRNPAAGGRAGGGLSDQMLAGRVRRAVFSDSRLNPFGDDIHVLVFNGRVVLRGQVRTERERRRIGARARRVAGNERVQNELLVVP